MRASAQQAQAPSDPTLAGCTVMVIEDHPDSRDMLSAILQSLRARVVLAANIDEAQRKLTFAGASLIVCDMKLPDGTGRDFIKWLRAQSKRLRTTPCLAVTGYEQHFPPNVAEGFDAYMRKPLNLDKFCTVAVALARRSAPPV